ncbi:MAG: GlpG-like [Planctomycetota bacterium]|nr:MAG: GlpG-like [Planctomycetota bacterium]
MPMGYEDRDYLQPTDSVERRFTMSRILMFVLIGANAISILWESTLTRTSIVGPVVAYFLLLRPIAVVHQFFVWQFATYWLFECSVWAVVFDALTLWWFGSMVEERIGLKKFAILWSGGILLPAVFFVALGYLLFPDVPYFGPGGAMLALTVAAALQWPNMGIIFIFVPMKLKWVALIYIAINLAYGLQSLGASYWSTLVGAAWGLVFWKYHDRVSAAMARWDANSERRASQRATVEMRQEAAEVDRVLEKIAKEGMPSLSSAEKKLLERASRKRRDA